MPRNHHASHTKELAALLNHCGRYVLVDILRGSHDCTNNGITAPGKGFSFFAPAFDGPFSKNDIKNCPNGVVLEVMDPAYHGCPFRFTAWLAVPHHVMDGGNFAYSSDSRFDDCYGGPIAVHDRYE